MIEQYQNVENDFQIQINYDQQQLDQTYSRKQNKFIKLINRIFKILRDYVA